MALISGSEALFIGEHGQPQHYHHTRLPQLILVSSSISRSLATKGSHFLAFRISFKFMNFARVPAPSPKLNATVGNDAGWLQRS
jgi:hypothetical protein